MTAVIFHTSQPSNFPATIILLCIVAHNNTYTYIHPFNDPLPGTTRVSRYQKGKTNLDFTEARDLEWKWHHLGHMQVCTSLQTDNHASTPTLSFLQARCPPAAQPTASKHCYYEHWLIIIINFIDKSLKVVVHSMKFVQQVILIHLHLANAIFSTHPNFCCSLLLLQVCN